MQSLNLQLQRHRYHQIGALLGLLLETEEEAKKERDKSLAIVRVNDRIDELNEGWEPTWERNSKEDKLMIVYHHYDAWDCLKGFDCVIASFSEHPTVIKYIKSEKKAKQIIEEMEEDLKLIFVVE